MSRAADVNPGPAIGRRSDAELRDQSVHVLWEFRQCMRLARHLYDRRHGGVTEMVDPLDAAALEAFCLHSRALVEFLWRDRNQGKRPMSQDAVAGDWFDTGSWRFEASLPDEVRDVHRRTGWGVAHISYKRLDPEEVWGWDHVAIGHRIASRLHDFSEDAPTVRLHPDFRREALKENLNFRENMALKEHAFEPSPSYSVGTPAHPHLWIARS